MSSFTILRHVPLPHGTLLFALQLSVLISSLWFFIYCWLSFLKKHWHIHVFVWVVKKRTALGVLFTQQVLLLEHCIENNFNFIFITSNFPKSDIPSWVFFTFVKMYKWYQIAQSIWYTLSMNVLSKKRWWWINNSEYFPLRRFKITN